MVSRHGDNHTANKTKREEGQCSIRHHRIVLNDKIFFRLQLKKIVVFVCGSATQHFLHEFCSRKEQKMCWTKEFLFLEHSLLPCWVLVNFYFKNMTQNFSPPGWMPPKQKKNRTPPLLKNCFLALDLALTKWVPTPKLHRLCCCIRFFFLDTYIMYVPLSNFCLICASTLNNARGGAW